jgi:hypothetical protein
MSDSDQDKPDDDAAGVDPPAEPRGAPTGGSGPTSMIPLIVDHPGDDVSVLWVRGLWSELHPGTVFLARGRRWVITGLSPSGVTMVCREVAET